MKAKYSITWICQGPPFCRRVGMRRAQYECDVCRQLHVDAEGKAFVQANYGQGVARGPVLSPDGSLGLLPPPPKEKETS